jgi:hypothetical protein
MQHKFKAVTIPLAMILGGCSAIFGGKETQYRVRAEPGARAFDPLCQFERGPLAIQAYAREKGGIVAVHLDITNRSTPRVTFRSARVTLYDRARERTCGAEFRDLKDRVVEEITVLGYETRHLEVRPAGSVDGWDGPIAVVFSGVRDDASEGGFDFTLLYEEIPEENPGAKAPAKPDAEPDARKRRPLRDSMHDSSDSSR